MATAGSAYVQLEELTGLALGASVPVGLLACALLVTNNLRDIPSDREAGKRTLAVRIGDRATRWLYTAMVGGALVAVPLLATERPWALIAVAALPLAVAPARSVLGGATGPQLIGVLAATGRLQLVYGAALAIGLWV